MRSKFLNFFLKNKVPDESVAKDEDISDQLFDQENNEEEDFEIPAFLRRQNFNDAILD